MEEKKILVACCSLDYILIEKLLSRLFTLDYVATCEEFSMKVKTQKYDLILADIIFVKSDYSLIRNIQPKIPVLALSSDPSDAREIQLQKNGYCACYIKPIRQELLTPFVKYWLEEFNQVMGENTGN